MLVLILYFILVFGTHDLQQVSCTVLPKCHTFTYYLLDWNQLPDHLVQNFKALKQ